MFAALVGPSIAVALALAAMFPRKYGGHPSAWTAIEYWEEKGDLPTVKSLVEGMEKATEKVRLATRSKLAYLKWAYAFTFLGFLCVAASVAVWLFAR